MKAPSKAQTGATQAKVDEQLIVDRIFSAVMEQRLKPRTKLSEAVLCESFGVGRMRVRRALLLLASQGIVELQSNRGAYIACPDPCEAREVFAARCLIESSVVRELAAGVDADALRRLREHLSLEDRARQRRERSDIIRLSGEFHVLLASCHGNGVLERLVRELVTRSSLIVGLFGGSRASSCPEDEHARIIEAIVAADAERAERVVRGHLQHIQAGLELDSPDPRDLDLKRILGGEVGG